MNEETEHYEIFSVLPKLWLVGVAETGNRPMSFFPQNQAMCFSLTGASDQNGLIYLISALQVSKLSPREGQLTCSTSHYKKVLE